jgi:hypothetical protein
MINLMNEREIFDYDKAKGQILNGGSHVENVFLAIGFASRCWKEESGNGTFDSENAVRIANELCAYMRLISAPIDNLEFLEWKLEKKEKEQQKCLLNKIS